MGGSGHAWPASNWTLMIKFWAGWSTAPYRHRFEGRSQRSTGRRSVAGWSGPARIPMATTSLDNLPSSRPCPPLESWTRRPGEKEDKPGNSVPVPGRLREVISEKLPFLDPEKTILLYLKLIKLLSELCSLLSLHTLLSPSALLVRGLMNEVRPRCSFFYMEEAKS